MANMEEYMEMDVETINIPLEDGTEMACAIMDEFTYNGNNYMMLCEIQDDDTIGEEMFCYRFREEGEDIILDYIDDEEELKAVDEAYQKYLDEIDE